MDIQEKETNSNEQKNGKLKKMLYAIAMVACLLLTIDTVRELYSIFDQWENRSSHTMPIIRKVLVMLGWGLLTWYTTDKYFKINGR